MTQRRRTATGLGIAMLVCWAVLARAADSPHATWIKAKCAVCHGEDGSGKTPEGQQMHVPDLRSPEVQKRSDSELREIIEKGHARMPSFKAALTQDQVNLLLYYIRSLVARK